MTNPNWREYGKTIKVEGGIKAQSTRGAIGESWWSKRFLGVLESFAMGGRLTRGRSYARAGQVLSMQISPGAVTSTVQGQAVPAPSVDLSAVRNDLKNLRTAQEAYFSDHNAYSSTIAGLAFTPSAGVTIKFVEAGPMAYAVSGTLDGKAGVSCVMFIGRVSAIPKTAQGVAARSEGGPLCDGDPPAGPAPTKSSARRASKF